MLPTKKKIPKNKPLLHLTKICIPLNINYVMRNLATIVLNNEDKRMTICILRDMKRYGCMIIISHPFVVLVQRFRQNLKHKLFLQCKHTDGALARWFQQSLLKIKRNTILQMRVACKKVWRSKYAHKYEYKQKF